MLNELKNSTGWMVKGCVVRTEALYTLLPSVQVTGEAEEGKPHNEATFGKMDLEGIWKCGRQLGGGQDGSKTVHLVCVC